MNNILKYLRTVVTYLTFAKILLENLDSNKIGWDDDFAKFIDKLIQDINLFIESRPIEIEMQAAKGYTATLSFCNDVLAKLDLLLISDLSKDEKISQMEIVEETLYNPNLVWQAKKGNDAELLSRTKEKAKAKIASVS